MAELRFGQDWLYTFGSARSAADACRLALFELEERASARLAPEAETGAPADITPLFMPEGMVAVEGTILVRNAANAGRTVRAAWTARRAEGCGTCRLLPVESHGLGHHETLAEALEHAWQEWVERDLFFQHWYAPDALRWRKLRLPPGADVPRDVDVRLVHLGCHDETDAVCAVLSGRGGFMVALAAARETDAAAEAALRELALFHTYHEAFLSKVRPRRPFRSFNDHLGWYWRHGATRRPWARETQGAGRPDETLRRADLWYEILPGAGINSGVTIRTVLPEACPQHGACHGALERVRPTLRRNLPRRLSGDHPFA